MHAELDNVLGSDRSPKLQDRPNLPYTEVPIEYLFVFSKYYPQIFLGYIVGGSED